MAVDGKVKIGTELDNTGLKKGIQNSEKTIRKSWEELAKESGKTVEELRNDAKKIAEEYQKQGYNIPNSYKKAYADMGVRSEKLKDQMISDADDIGKSWRGIFSGIGSFAKKGFGVLGDAAVAASKIAVSAIASVATVLGGVAAASAKVGMEFEAQMSRVKAISGATADELTRLQEQAKELGATTSFSATEAAQGMENLASAGFKTEEVMAAMPGMLDLAASSGEDLATSADIAASTLRGFGLEATEAAHVADVLAKNAADTNAAVADTGDAMKYIAPVAHSMGLSLEEVAASIGIMADSGTQGSQAGTSLRGALSRLAKPTDDMAEKMEELGLSFYDSDGKMKSLSEMVGMLKTNMEDLTDEEKQNALVTLFGQEALSGMMVLMEAGSERIDNLTESYKNCDGAAAEMAATMVDNLKGAVDELGGAAETFQLELYDRMEKPLKGLAQLGTECLNELTEAFRKDGFDGLMETGTRLLSDLAIGIAEGLPAVIDTAAQVIASFTENLNANLPSLMTAGGQLLLSLVSGAMTMLSSCGTLAYGIVNTLFTALVENLPTIVQSGISMLLSFVEGVVSALPVIVDAGIQLLLSLAQGVADSLPELIEKVPRIINSFADTVYASLPKILAAGVKILVTLGQGIINSIPTIIANAGQIVLAIINVFSLVNLASMGKNIISGLGNGIKSMASWVKTIAKQIVEQLKHPFSAEGWKTIGKNIISGIANGIKGSASKIVDAAKKAAKSALEAAKDFLGIHSPSTVMRDVIGKNMIAGINSGILAETPELEKTSVRSVSKAVQSMQGVTYERSGQIGAEVAGVSPERPDKDHPPGSPGRKLILEVPVSIDGREVARATAEYTDEQIAWEGL